MQVRGRIIRYTSVLSVCLFASFAVVTYGLEGAQAQKATPPAKPVALQAPAAAAQEAITVPPPEELLVLIRTALIALNQSNQTGNYTTLRDLGAPSLQAANSAVQLGAGFASLRDQGIDLSATVVVAPQVSVAPEITSEGLLHITGVFPTQPLQIQFELLYQNIANKWRIYGMSVNAVQSAVVATAAPATQKTAAKKIK